MQRNSKDFGTEFACENERTQIEVTTENLCKRSRLARVLSKLKERECSKSNRRSRIELALVRTPSPCSQQRQVERELAGVALANYKLMPLCIQLARIDLPDCPVNFMVAQRLAPAMANNLRLLKHDQSAASSLASQSIALTYLKMRPRGQL